jgi:hypothetical protein
MTGDGRREGRERAAIYAQPRQLRATILQPQDSNQAANGGSTRTNRSTTTLVSTIAKFDLLKPTRHYSTLVLRAASRRALEAAAPPWRDGIVCDRHLSARNTETPSQCIAPLGYPTACPSTQCYISGFPAAHVFSVLVFLCRLFLLIPPAPH